MIIEKRSIPAAILLSLVTCGLYTLYWEYKVYESLYRANNIPNTAGIDVLLSIVTCGLYGLYMMYKAGKLESSAFRMYNLPHKDDSVIYVILALFSVGIISMCILQSSINNTLADTVNNQVYGPDNRLN